MKQETTKTVSVYAGPSAAMLLGVLFVGLKLTGHIDWSWLWVTAPFWVPFLVSLVLFVVVFLFLVIKEYRK